MSNKKIITLAVGVALATFFLSIFFSINMVSVTPKNLAKVMKQDPVLFMETLQGIAKDAQQMRAQKTLASQMKNPVKIATEGRVIFGNQDAPITIAEYSDFQCPYCARANTSMKNIIKKYDGKVRVILKHFPLSFHAFAKPAAVHFEAVAMIDHGKAKKFHDYIFDNFTEYARLKEAPAIQASLNKTLKKLGISKSAVKANLKKATMIVEADMKEGEKNGVNGTPNFFVNGVSAKDVGTEVLVEKFLKNL